MPKDKIIKRYAVGQVINLRQRDKDGNIIKRFKVKVIEFYRHFILTERRGIKECFTYWDFERLTHYEKREKIA